MRTSRVQQTRGFTLVELLVVITIIGILIAILVPAVNIARLAAKRMVITTEIAALSQACEAYKNSVGDYPPNFDKAALLNRHLSKRQRLAPAQITSVPGDGIPQFEELIVGGKHAIDPAEALVFWLGGQSPPNGSTTNGNFLGGGLRNNPVVPLQPAAGPGEIKSFFEFDASRLKDRDNDGWYEYTAPGTGGGTYVFFDSRSYSAYSSGVALPAFPNDGIDRGVCRPVANIAIPTQQQNYLQPTSFQIISTGLDGVYMDSATASNPAMAYAFPTGPYPPAERDNMANFSAGKTYQESIP